MRDPKGKASKAIPSCVDLMEHFLLHFETPKRHILNHPRWLFGHSEVAGVPTPSFQVL
jgi:hypothetical protein